MNQWRPFVSEEVFTDESREATPEAGNLDEHDLEEDEDISSAISPASDDELGELPPYMQIRRTPYSPTAFVQPYIPNASDTINLMSEKIENLNADNDPQSYSLTELKTAIKKFDERDLRTLEQTELRVYAHLLALQEFYEENGIDTDKKRKSFEINDARLHVRAQRLFINKVIEQKRLLESKPKRGLEKGSAAHNREPVREEVLSRRSAEVVKPAESKEAVIQAYTSACESLLEYLQGQAFKGYITFSFADKNWLNKAFDALFKLLGTSDMGQKKDAVEVGRKMLDFLTQRVDVPQELQRQVIDSGENLKNSM